MALQRLLSIQKEMNHYSYGAISGWLFGDVCGIRLSEGKLTIAPKPSKALMYAQAKWDSPVGTIESRWHYAEEQIILEVTIPSNVAAESHLPDGSVIHTEAGTHTFTCKA